MARKQGEVRWTGQKEASNARRLWVREGSLWGPSSPSRITVYDSPLLDATLDALEPLGELPDRASVHLDRAYDSTATRRRLAARCLVGEISEKGKPAPLKAGKRQVVERTNS